MPTGDELDALLAKHGIAPAPPPDYSTADLDALLAKHGMQSTPAAPTPEADYLDALLAKHGVPVPAPPPEPKVEVPPMLAREDSGIPESLAAPPVRHTGVGGVAAAAWSGLRNLYMPSEEEAKRFQDEHDAQVAHDTLPMVRPVGSTTGLTVEEYRDKQHWDAEAAQMAEEGRQAALKRDFAKSAGVLMQMGMPAGQVATPEQKQAFAADLQAKKDYSETHGLVNTLLDYTSRPRDAIQGVLMQIAKDQSASGALGRGFKGQGKNLSGGALIDQVAETGREFRARMYNDPSTSEEMKRYLRMRGEAYDTADTLLRYTMGDDLTEGLYKTAHAAAGFAVDVGTDPLTLLLPFGKATKTLGGAVLGAEEGRSLLTTTGGRALLPEILDKPFRTGWKNGTDAANAWLRSSGIAQHINRRLGLMVAATQDTKDLTQFVYDTRITVEKARRRLAAVYEAKSNMYNQIAAEMGVSRELLNEFGTEALETRQTLGQAAPNLMLHAGPGTQNANAALRGLEGRNAQTLAEDLSAGLQVNDWVGPGRGYVLHMVTPEGHKALRQFFGGGEPGQNVHRFIALAQRDILDTVRGSRAAAIRESRAIANGLSGATESLMAKGIDRVGAEADNTLQWMASAVDLTMRHPDAQVQRRVANLVDTLESDLQKTIGITTREHKQDLGALAGEMSHDLGNISTTLDPEALRERVTKLRGWIKYTQDPNFAGAGKQFMREALARHSRELQTVLRTHGKDVKTAVDEVRGQMGQLLKDAATEEAQALKDGVTGHLDAAGAALKAAVAQPGQAKQDQMRAIVDATIESVRKSVAAHPGQLERTEIEALVQRTHADMNGLINQTAQGTEVDVSDVMKRLSSEVGREMNRVAMEKGTQGVLGRTLAGKYQPFTKSRTSTATIKMINELMVQKGLLKPGEKFMHDDPVFLTTMRQLMGETARATVDFEKALANHPMTQIPPPFKTPGERAAWERANNRTIIDTPGQLQGKSIPKEAATFVDGMQRLNDPEDRGFLNQANNALMKIWKPLAVYTMPSTITRNVTSNVFNNWEAGMGVRALPNYGRAFVAMAGFGDGVLHLAPTASTGALQIGAPAANALALRGPVMLDGAPARYSRILEKMGEEGHLDQTMFNSIWHPAGMEPNQHKMGLLRGLFSTSREYNPILKAFAVGHNMTEQHAKIAHVMWKLENGAPWTEAIQSMERTLFSPDKMTGFEKTYMRTAFPFWYWSWQDAQLQTERVLRRPQILSQVDAAKREIEYSFGEGPKWDSKYFPEHIQKDFFLNLGTDPEDHHVAKVLRGFQFPLYDFMAGGLDAPTWFGDKFNPILKTMAEEATDTNFFRSQQRGWPWKGERQTITQKGSNVTMLGISMHPRVAHLLGLIPPVTFADRTNPGDVFGKAGEYPTTNLGSFEPGLRTMRHRSPEGERMDLNADERTTRAFLGAIPERIDTLQSFKNIVAPLKKDYAEGVAKLRSLGRQADYANIARVKTELQNTAHQIRTETAKYYLEAMRVGAVQSAEGALDHTRQELEALLGHEEAHTIQETKP